MRRRACTIFVVLLMGLLANVSVALGCALLIEFSPVGASPNCAYDKFQGSGAPDLEKEDRRYAYYGAHRYERTGASRVTIWYKGMGFSGFGGDHSSAKFEAMIPDCAEAFFDIPEMKGGYLKRRDEASTHRITVDRRGWPCLALWGGMKTPLPHLIFYDEARKRIQLEERTHGLIKLDETESKPFWSGRVLPLRPIWPGFAINTLFYATALWLLFAFPVTLRRWNRTRRGLCSKCAYPIGTSPVCTECGNALRVRADNSEGK